MIIRLARIKPFLFASLVVLAVAGCRSQQSDDKDADPSKKPDKKEATVVQLHMEVQEDNSHDSTPVEVGLENPITINVEKDAFVDGGDLETAAVVDDSHGGFQIRLKFNADGSDLLSAETYANPGRRVAIFCQFGAGKEKNRFIASPKIDKPISNGVLTFTPAVTRDEADRIVRGLNNVAKKIKKDSPFNEKLFQ